MSKNREIIYQQYPNTISLQSKIIEALKVMNDVKINLLVVLDNHTFIGLLSIGDIRRAILDNIDINKTEIKSIMRKNILVAHEEDSIEKIKNLMIERRIVCMPVVNKEYKLIDIHYWDKLFSAQKVKKSLDVDVVIMAGGKGSRLKPITNIIPKPLVPIGERPIIEVIIDNFMQYQIKDFYISVNYKAEMIESYLKSKESPTCHLHYFTEDQPLGTIGSLYLIQEKLEKTIFVSNCDIIIEDDYAEIYNYHKESNNDITIVSALKHLNIPYGVIKTEKGGSLNSMIEKPDYTFQVNTGMYILEPDVIKKIPKETFYHITDLIEEVKKSGKVGVFPVAEKSWHDIGQWKEYQSTLDNYKEDYK
jgi:dTDP-glucose pyrophosphorylase